MTEPHKELQALGAFLGAMHDQGLDGANMRAAMLQALGVQAAQPDCRTCDSLRISYADLHKYCLKPNCTNGDKYEEAAKVKLWRTEA